MPEVILKPQKIHYVLLALAVVSAGLAYISFEQQVAGWDWTEYFLLAIDDWSNRYDYAVFNPPWLILFLQPLAWLGTTSGFVIISVLNVCITAWSVYALSQDRHWYRMVLVLASLPMLHVFVLGQLDAILLLGMTLAALAAPQQWGQLAFGGAIAILKPQVFLGGLVISFWKSTRKAYVIGAALAFSILSSVIWGFWMLEITTGQLADVPWNRAFPLFPLGYVLGVPLIMYGMRQKNETFGLMAMPFLVPYYGPHSVLVMFVFLASQVPYRWVPLVSLILAILVYGSVFL